jgi:signal transduction histidine kinase
VTIAYGADRVELTVRDDGEAPGPSAMPAEVGSGLLGMRERVALYRGSLTSRARPEGGFELVATLPIEPA